MHAATLHLMPSTQWPTGPRPPAGPRPERLLVLADRLAATQTISFGRLPWAAAGGPPVTVQLASAEEVWASTAQCHTFWNEFGATALVLSRCVERRAMEFIPLARATGVPVVYHLDDDLLDVPESLGATKAAHYREADRLGRLRAALDAADLVYASTRPLAERLVEHGLRVPVVAGDLYCSVDPTRLPAPWSSTGPVVGYMGTGGHARDLEMVAPAIAALMRSQPELRFETFGTIKPVEALRAFGDRYQHRAGEADYDTFLARLRELGWWVGLAPLEDSVFNRCKADTKWVEYSLAGMAVLASDVPVYHRACADDCGLLAGPPEAWREALAGLVLDAQRRLEMVANARRKLADTYSHERLARQLLEVVGLARRLAERRSGESPPKVKHSTRGADCPRETGLIAGGGRARKGQRCSTKGS